MEKGLMKEKEGGLKIFRERGKQKGGEYMHSDLFSLFYATFRPHSRLYSDKTLHVKRKIY
jgi:hypothetical protein